MTLNERIADERYMATMDSGTGFKSRLDKAQKRRDMDFATYRESQDAFIRQLKGCDLCKDLNCPEKQKGWSEILMCPDLLLEGSCNG